MKQEWELSRACLMMVLILSSGHMSGLLHSCKMLLLCPWDFSFWQATREKHEGSP